MRVLAAELAACIAVAERAVVVPLHQLSHSGPELVPPPSVCTARGCLQPCSCKPEGVVRGPSVVEGMAGEPAELGLELAVETAPAEAALLTVQVGVASC